MVALATFNTACTVVFALGLARFITSVFAGAQPGDVRDNLAVALVAGLARGLLIWLQELLSARAAIAVKQQLRQKYLSAIANLGDTWISDKSSAKITNLATTGLDALDAYFSRYLPQLAFTAIATPLLALVIFMSDLTSGFTLLLTVPLIPVFMILIGLLTKGTQSRQIEALHYLSQHLFEVLRGMTMLRVFSREKAQISNIAKLADELRVRTMRILRITFLSSFALELIASLSVALIAVSIGLRLVNGDLAFSTGLFILLLAPEVFLPIRAVGTNFHAAAEGIQVSSEILDTISLKPSPTLPSKPTVAAGITLVTGSSGAGKSTYLSELLHALSEERCAWMPQSVMLFSDTVEANIVGPDQPTLPTEFARALELAALDDVEPTTVITENAASLSGGQAQRVSLARTFYRALTNPKVEYLLLDEPISALDDVRAAKVIHSLRLFAEQGKSIIAISHRKFEADQVVEIAGQSV